MKFNIFKKSEPKKIVDKKSKWINHRERIFNALVSNAHENKLDQLKENLLFLTEDEYLKYKMDILRVAIKNASHECAYYLVDSYKGPLPNNKHFYRNVLMDCDYNKIHLVYNLLEQIQIDNNIQDLDISSFRNMLINRLIDPAKIEANPRRVEYLHKLLETRFFTIEEVKESINTFIKSGSKKSLILPLLREITFRELGI